jgi:hypothetical protein
LQVSLGRCYCWPPKALPGRGEGGDRPGSEC